MPLANTKVRNSTGIFSSIYDIALAATLNFDLGYSFEWFNITLWSDGRHLPQLLVAMTSHVMGCRVSLILICNASTCAHLIEKKQISFPKKMHYDVQNEINGLNLIGVRTFSSFNR